MSLPAINGPAYPYKHPLLYIYINTIFRSDSISCVKSLDNFGPLIWGNYRNIPSTGTHIQDIDRHFEGHFLLLMTDVAGQINTSYPLASNNAFLANY
jgi:hypothetical protein